MYAAGVRNALRSPMFAPVAPWLLRLPADRFPSLDELNALLTPEVRSGGDAPLRFAPPGARARSFESNYEVRAYLTGEICTRAESWHDLFNGLVWLAFPVTKAVLNRGHYEHMSLAWRAARSPDAARSVSGSRGTARDVLTLFDEGGVIVASCEPALLRLLRGFQWKTLFWSQRHKVLECMRFFILGHALYEKALQPYKGVTARALLIEVPQSFLSDPFEEQLAQADRRAAQWFGKPDALSSTRTLSPLPILGVPGWADNNDCAFYDDVDIFRPGYRRAPRSLKRTR